MKRYVVPLVCVLALPAAAGAAESGGNGRAVLFKAVMDCRSIEAPAERLSCYDRTVATLDVAETKKDIVVMDRAAVGKTRRTLFGLTLPRLDIFGGGDDEDDALSEIEAKVQSASRDRNSRWLIRLEDGALWRQVDSKDIGRPPRAGSQVRIRRAALGSYFMNIDGQIAIRARREN